MKICFLHMTMGLTNRGSEISTDILAQKLAKKNDVLLLHSGYINTNKYVHHRIFPIDNLKIESDTFIKKILSRFYLDSQSKQIKKFSIAAIKHILTFKPDIIVATNGYPQIKILKKLKIKSKIVVFGRAGIGYHDLDNLRAIPDLFIALSETSEQWAHKNANPKTVIKHIPNPINSHSFKKAKLTIKKPIVLIVGALTKHKNIVQTIEALKEIPVSILLIGNGEDSDKISKIFSNYLNDFSWIKSVEQQEISKYYNSVQVFCFLPSRQEPFGRVYLEAMQAGLPIVASDDPIRRDIIGENGFFVNPMDKKAIQKAVMSAISLEKVDYENMLHKYNSNFVSSSIEKVFYEILQKNN